jgi:predicted esterase
VETGGASYNYPSTRIHIIVGGQDNVIIHNHADDYLRVLKAARQPMLTWQEVPRMGHQITQSQEGLDALFAALTQGKPAKGK